MQALIQESYGLWLALTVASSFICTWVYTHTGGSVLIGRCCDRQQPNRELTGWPTVALVGSPAP